ncbi:MAG: aminoglycoside 6'-N-acetyltransferase [Acutalibacteraceae bacterium]|nr:aminoglycoside 6'-N-acetyltransferase [Acutalibacteraceae bacterium]
MIYEMTEADLLSVAEMAVIMWSSHSVEELVNEFRDSLKSNDSVVFIMSQNNKPIGFAQCQLRHDYVEGTKGNPVGYLEGVFINQAYRNNGYAKELLRQCESWALEKGCKEFASDCELDNNTSFLFHLKNGFTEANRIICFTKKL